MNEARLRATVTVKTVYGIPTFYPSNPVAQLAADLANQKTLTQTTIAILKRNGIKVEVESESIEL